MARIQFCPVPGAETCDTGVKEWKPLAELRPVPPEPPGGWQERLRMYDVVEVRHEDGWIEATYHETLLPSTQSAEVVHAIRKARHHEVIRLSGDQLRPLWALNSDSRQWALASRRVGPSSSVLLTLRADGAEWSLIDQTSVAGPPLPFNPDEPRAATTLEQTVCSRPHSPSHACMCDLGCRMDCPFRCPSHEAGTAVLQAASRSEQPELCTVLLNQENGVWSFGGGSVPLTTTTSPPPSLRPATLHALYPSTFQPCSHSTYLQAMASSASFRLLARRFLRTCCHQPHRGRLGCAICALCT